MSTPTTPFPFHEDPGHGWIQVPVALLHDLGIADCITGYSYVSRDGRTAFLEEDCDYSTFHVAWEKRHGSRPPTETIHYDYDAPMRQMRGYPAAEGAYERGDAYQREHQIAA